MSILSLPKNGITFLRDVKIELGKVSWPDRATTSKFTVIVIGLSLAVAVFLGGLDFVFNLVLKTFVL